MTMICCSCRSTQTRCIGISDGKHWYKCDLCGRSWYTYQRE